MAKIKIIVNGKEKEVFATTIEELVKELEITGTMFVIEQNLNIVQKEDYAMAPLNENDAIEIVGFFGGG